MYLANHYDLLPATKCHTYTNDCHTHGPIHLKEESPQSHPQGSPLLGVNIHETDKK